MEYKIFRLTTDGFLKDIGYTTYTSYINAEAVVRTLKKENKKKRYIIFKLY